MPLTKRDGALPRRSSEAVDESPASARFQGMRFFVSGPVMRMTPLIPQIAKGSECNEYDRRDGAEEHPGEQHNSHPQTCHPLAGDLPPTLSACDFGRSDRNDSPYHSWLETSLQAIEIS